MSHWIDELRQRPTSRAAAAIAAFGPAVKPAVSELLRLLREVPNRAFDYAPAFRSIGEGTAEAVELLAAMLTPRNRDSHWLIARALRAFGPDAAPAADRLAALLTRFDAMATAGIAIRALAEMGAAARPVAPRLMECLGRQLRALQRAESRGDYGRFEEIERRCAWFVSALGEIGAAEAVSLVTEFFNLSFDLATAAIALRRLGVPPPEIVDRLVAELRDPDPDVRCAAAVGLSELADDAKAAIPDLTRALRDRSSRVRGAAAEALCLMGIQSAEVIKWVRMERLSHGVWFFDQIRRRLGGDAVPALVAALRRNDPDDRAAAARALAELGPAAESAVPELTRLLTDPHATVREAAAEALAKIPTRSPALSGAAAESPAGLEPMLPKRPKGRPDPGRGAGR